MAAAKLATSNGGEILLKTLVGTLAVLSSVVTVFVFVSGLASLQDAWDVLRLKTLEDSSVAIGDLLFDPEEIRKDGFLTGVFDGLFSLPRAAVVRQLPPYNSENTGWLFYKVGVLLGAILISLVGGFCAGAFGNFVYNKLDGKDGGGISVDVATMLYPILVFIPAILFTVSWFFLIVSRLMIA